MEESVQGTGLRKGFGIDLELNGNVANWIPLSQDNKWL
jgi:hypothetical protein